MSDTKPLPKTTPPVFSRAMFSLIVITAVLLRQSLSQTADRTQMVVLDSGTATAYRINLGLNISDYTVTEYSVPALVDFKDVDYDFVDDRLYILQGYRSIVSVFVNGSDERHVADLEYDSYTVAVDPHDKKVFAGLLRHRNVPAKVIAMDIDGSNVITLRTNRLEAAFMGVDYQNKYLYWNEFLCSCLFRVRYNGGEVEKFAEHIYVKQSPHAVDFQNNLLYGNARNGLFRITLANETERLIYRYDDDYRDATVYDPKTNRLFLTNDGTSSEVAVLTAQGEFQGNLQGLQLTADEKKIVRVNPL